MPLYPSHDFGNVNGFVHSHQFRGGQYCGSILLRRYEAVAGS